MQTEELFSQIKDKLEGKYYDNKTFMLIKKIYGEINEPIKKKSHKIIIPFYGYIKMGILIWLFGSCTNGSHRIYKNYIEPYFKKYDFSKLNLSDIFGNVDINQVFFDKNKSINLNTIKNYIKTNFNVENLEIPSEIIDAIVNHNNKINQPPDQD